MRTDRQNADVPKLDLVPGGTPAGPADGFEVAFADEDGEHRLPLLNTVPVAFESCQPVREFPSFKSQRHYPGQWWTATTGTLIGYESWLERDTLIGLDFDADVVGLSSQPFWLFWTDASGKPRSHAPDYFAQWHASPQGSSGKDSEHRRGVGRTGWLNASGPVSVRLPARSTITPRPAHLGLVRSSPACPSAQALYQPGPSTAPQAL
jgi:hypothetical protein